jgi:hypothetical protein
MTRIERAKLMIEDYEAYAELVPKGHWLQLLEAIAKSEGITEEEKRSLEENT